MSGLLDTADFSAVVADVYEASLSPAHWDLALTGLVSRFGPPRWDVAMLVWERLMPGGGRFVASAGVNDLARSVYLQHFAGSNEWSVRGHDLAIGSVVHSDRLIDRAGFANSVIVPVLRDFEASGGDGCVVRTEADQRAAGLDVFSGRYGGQQAQKGGRPGIGRILRGGGEGESG